MNGDSCLKPQSKWNYAPASDKFEFSEQDFDVPFTTECSHAVLTAEMTEIKWEFNRDHCDRLPASAKPIGCVQKIKLIPMAV